MFNYMSNCFESEPWHIPTQNDIYYDNFVVVVQFINTIKYY